MRIPRIFQNTDFEVDKNYQLDARAFKHLIQVLRLQQDNPVILFNGNGGEYEATLTEVNKRKASVLVKKYAKVENESSLAIHLAQSLSKGDRFDYVIQKSVELGVKEITPIVSQRSQLKISSANEDKKLEHWRKIALSASEQCGRCQIVKIHPPLKLNHWLESPPANTKLVLHPVGGSSLPNILKESNTSLADFSLLVGPEGGFEEKEIQLATSAGFVLTQFGQRTLRTETAPLVAITALQSLLGDFR